MVLCKTYITRVIFNIVAYIFSLVRIKEDPYYQCIYIIQEHLPENSFIHFFHQNLNI